MTDKVSSWVILAQARMCPAWRQRRQRDFIQQINEWTKQRKPFQKVTEISPYPQHIIGTVITVTSYSGLKDATISQDLDYSFNSSDVPRDYKNTVWDGRNIGWQTESSVKLFCPRPGCVQLGDRGESPSSREFVSVRGESSLSREKVNISVQ